MFLRAPVPVKARGGIQSAQGHWESRLGWTAPALSGGRGGVPHSLGEAAHGGPGCSWPQMSLQGPSPGRVSSGRGDSSAPCSHLLHAHMCFHMRWHSCTHSLHLSLLTSPP